MMQSNIPFGFNFDAQLTEGEFQNREQDFRKLDTWLESAVKQKGKPALLLGQRGIGKTVLIGEWLKGRLPDIPKSVIPFYYSFKPYALDAAVFSRSYFSSFVLQYISCRLPETKRIATQNTSWENLKQLAEMAGSPSLIELIDAVEEAHNSRDTQNLINLVISAPHWIAKFERLTIPVIIDHAEFMQKIYSADSSLPLWSTFQSVYNIPNAPHLFVGTRPSLKTAVPELFSEFSSMKTIEVEPLDLADSMSMLKNISDTEGIQINIDILEHVATQLRGCPFYMRSFIDRAKAGSVIIENLPQVQKLYAEEIIEGSIHWYWRSILQTHFPSIHLRRSVLKLCHDLLNKKTPTYNLRVFATKFGLEERDFNDLLQLLQLSGIIAESFGNIQLTNDTILHDVITAMYWRDIENISTDGVVQRIVQQRLLAHTTMVQRQPSQKMVGSLQQLLNSFNGQHIMNEMLRYNIAIKAQSQDQTFSTKEETLLRLPVIIGTINENEFNQNTTPQSPDVVQPPHLISFGFYDAKYAPGYQMIWLTIIYAGLETITTDEVLKALEIKSHVERRFETPVQYVWMISNESFTDEALELGNKNRVYTSNLDMVQRLTNYLMHAKPVTPVEQQNDDVKISDVPTAPNQISQTEFEIELPVAPDLEILAAQSMEQIAEIAKWESSQIGKLKMALLEAVLQVVQYQTKTGQRVHVKFEILTDRLNMVVENINPVSETSLKPEQQKKLKNGINLIQKLTDKLDIKKTAKGRSIYITSFRTAPEKNRGNG